ncbi:unnamed protein product [Ceratitis capitata]|uniref:(Mediterranean fruit fly) hypothetical protein n=1 Tax=Ceratitis capitata TaxID=7213 RepID=A0A811VG43_CERCA|nr:unnamed protein product [Ceratitis capitata]
MVLRHVFTVYLTVNSLCCAGARTGCELAHLLLFLPLEYAMQRLLSQRRRTLFTAVGDNTCRYFAFLLSQTMGLKFLLRQFTVLVDARVWQAIVISLKPFLSQLPVWVIQVHPVFLPRSLSVCLSGLCVGCSSKPS